MPRPAKGVIWGTLAFLVATSLVLLSVSGGGTVAGPNRAGDAVVPRSEADTWMAHLASGGEVEFRDRLDASPGSLGRGDPGAGGTSLGRNRPFGKLSASQKATAVARVDVFARGAVDDYKRLPTGTPEEIIASLNAALEIVVYEEAATAIHNDAAMVFLAGDGDEDMQRAWRNVPRGWRKMVVHNAAETGEGASLNIIVALDPAEHPAIQSLLEQQEAVASSIR